LVRPILHKAIQGTEFEDKVYFAGGCVRDEILGRQTCDIDLTVELPDGGIRLAEYLFKCGVASKPITYKQFGTALVQIETYKIELVMTRRESYRQRSRKPEVEFGTLEEDVLRRDFTVNSLLMNVSDGTILDLCGKGRADLRAKLIRATSPPDIIFREDPLRLLRAIRFATVLGFEIERKTSIYIKHHSTALKHISQERIAEEMHKILDSSSWLCGLKMLAKSGLKPFVFPELRIPSRLYNIASHNLSLTLKPSLLFYKSRLPETYLRRLKLAKSEITYICNLISLCKKARLMLRIGKLKKDRACRKLTYEIGSAATEFELLFSHSAILYPKGMFSPKSDQAFIEKIRLAALQMRKHRFSLTGDDLIRTFCIKSSPEVGRLLAKGLDYWFEHPGAGKSELLSFLENKVKRI
jgi:tRNA nucleotidyltransferase/poly(A) polymerase